MTRARDLANIADGTFTATDLNLSGTLDVSGDATFDTNTLFVDVSANNVGVGTTSPSFTAGNKGIHIADATSPAIRLQDTNNANSDFTIYSPDGDNSLRIYHENNATDFVSITSEGNVGIGTSSPSAGAVGGKVLHVQNSGATASVRVDRSDAATAGTLSITSGNTSNGILSTGAKDLSISTNSTEAMRIDSSGNVGISVVPENSSGTWRNLQFGGGNLAFRNSGANDAMVGTGYLFKTDNSEVYKNAEAVSRLFFDNSAMIFQQAGSGTAGAAISWSEAMRIDSSGNVGIGESNPSGNCRLHVTDADVQMELEGTVGANSGFIDFDGTNLQLSTSRDMKTGAFRNTGKSNATVTLTGASGGSTIRFYTASADNTAGIERARIDSSGRLLVGTTNSAPSVGEGIKLFPTGGLYVAGSSGLADTFNYYNTTVGAYRFYVNNAGTIFAANTSISAISDQRFKENVQDLDAGLDAVMSLKPRKFDWKEGKGKNIKGDRGFIAQEFEQVFPDLIDEWKDPAPEGEEPYKSVRPDLIPVLVKAIQEQQEIINDLRARVAQLEGV